MGGVEGVGGMGGVGGKGGMGGMKGTEKNVGYGRYWRVEKMGSNGGIWDI